jgi:hypothetical protein
VGGVTLILYAATALALLWLADRFVIPISRGAAVALLLLPLCFTGRALLTGRVYAPLEMPYMVRPLLDYRADMHLGPPHNNHLGDIAFHILPWREATRRALADGEWPLFNRYILCGDNLAATGQPAVYSPFTLIACLLPAPISFTYTGAIGFFLAGFSAFLFARVLDRSMLASIVAAIGYMFSAPLALHVLFPLGTAWALCPLVLAATRLVVRSPGVRSGGFLTVALALLIFAGHPETVLHVAAIGAAYGLFERPGIKAVATAICAGAIALLLTAIYLLPLLDAVPKTGEYIVRSMMYARGPLRIPSGFVHAAGISDVFPFFRVRFQQFLLPRAEAGSILLALAVFAIWRVRTREVWFFAAALVIGFMAGTNAWPVAQILHRLPLFDTALNDRLSSLVPLSLAMLAAYAIDNWSPRHAAAAMGALLVVIAIAAIALPGPIDVPRLFAETVPLTVAAFLALIRTEWAITAIVAMLLVQRTIADGGLVPVHSPDVAYPRIPIIQSMRSDTPFRVIGTGEVFLANTPTMYALESPLGSAATTLAEYAELYPLWRPFGAVTDLSRPILSLMNVRYAVTELATPVPDGWHVATVDRASQLLENDRVLPRAFVPRYVRFGVAKKDEVDQIAAESDFRERAWLAVDIPQQEHPNGPGTATTVPAKSGFDVQVKMQNAGYVVISESAWPAWRAYVDGRRVKTIRADHAFLGVYVPAGQHRVRLRFLPQSFVIGRALSFATLLLAALALVLFPMLPR